MKVIFLNVGGFSPQHSGVWQKILSQHNALLNKGVSSSLLLINYSGSKTFDAPIGINEPLPLSSNNPTISRIRKLFEKKNIYEKALMQIREQDPDIVYLRFPTGDPFFLFFLNRIEKPVVTEHQTNEIRELAANQDWPKFFFEKVLGAKIRSKTNGMVCVTNEIAQNQSQTLARATNTLIPIRVISNGISLYHSPARRKVPVLDQEINLIFVGNISKWHGLDLIVKGIANYRGPKKIKLNIFGSGEYKQTLLELIKRHNVDRNIKCWGPMPPKELDSKFEDAHLGIGSFGRYRTGMREGCALKLREYCVRGIPFIDGTVDTDFPLMEFPFGMYLPPNKDGYIDFSQVVYFVENVYRNYDPLEMVKEMRTYAERKLDWNVKIEELINFFQYIIGTLEK
jgi:glycosyltransferase involved in cell wall biosynthesis